MAKRKKVKISSSGGKKFFSRVFDWFQTLPSATRKIILGAGWVFGGLFLFLAFLNLAGPVGQVFFLLFEELLGWGKWFLPVGFLFLGFFLFFRPEPEKNSWNVGFGLGLLFLSLLGLGDLFEPGRFGFLGRFLGGLEELIGFWATLSAFLMLLVIGFALDFWEWVRNLLLQRRTKPVAPIKLPVVELNSKEQEKEKEEKRKEIAPVEVKPVFPEKKTKSVKKISLESAGWRFPPLELLETDGSKPTVGDIRINSQIIQRTLADFGIPVEMGEVNIGPTVTQYTLKPAQGIKLSRIVALQNDLALALAAHPLRIEAPIPGKSLVGIEVPNKTPSLVRLRALLEFPTWAESPLPLLFPLGRDVMGNPVFADISKLPHLLIAGATGAGKSIFIHTILTSLIYRNPPTTLKFILIDPKRVELSAYAEIPYLLCPVITEGRKAISALKWATLEMERRYDLLLEEKARDIHSYNQKVGKNQEKALPYLLIFIDELADLMTAYGKELETIIIRLSQMARATGIHLIVSTQRPSVEVITGLIKANITARIAFQVASQVDSRTILDTAGAEKLLGRGDLLFISAETSKPKRIQAPFISEKEVERVVVYLKEASQQFFGKEVEYDPEILAMFNQEATELDETELLGDEDELYQRAYEVVTQSRKASASLLQRRLRIGYARAARLLDMLEARGVIGPQQGAKPREVYLSDSSEDKEEQTLLEDSSYDSN